MKLPSVAAEVKPTLTSPWPSRDGLHRWMANVTGAAVPRKPVCPDHQAPLDFVWAIFNHDVSDALVMANRGGGKRIDVAGLHLANAHCKAGFETSHIGAIKTQAKRCYRYYRAGLRHDSLSAQAPDPHIESTEWKNGSWIEILPGTEAQTQGGHPMLVAFDELESGKLQPWENAKSMPTEWKDEDGQKHVGQFIATSTRVTSLGLMQHALDEAKEQSIPTFTWCIFETMEPCDGQDGRPACVAEACPLWKWCGPCEAENKGGQLNGIKGGNLTGSLHGRAVHADGWRSLSDVLSFFNRVSTDTWEAQGLCLKPLAKALIYANFTEANVSVDAAYDPDGGALLLCYDWGFTDPYHVGMLQVKDGIYYQFDELTGTGTSERDIVRALVRRVTELEGYDGPSYEEWEKVWEGKRQWPKPWPKVWPDLAAGDPSAVQLRAELKSHGIATKQARAVKHDVVPGQDVMRAAILTAGGLRRYVVHPQCATTIKGFQNYRARELDDGSFSAKPDPDPANHRFSHPTDAARYLMWTQRRVLGLGAVESEGGE